MKQGITSNSDKSEKLVARLYIKNDWQMNTLLPPS